MVLVLAVLIIATVLVTAVIFSNLLLSEIQQSRLIDNSIQAYYLAEGGAERALYQSRRKEAVKAQDCVLIIPGNYCREDDGYCSFSTDKNKVACITETSGDLDIRGQWQIEVSNEPETTVFLDVGQSFQLDLFNPYQGGSFVTNVESFQVSSDIDSGATLYGELTNLTWLVGGSLNCPLDNFVPARPAISKERITLYPEDGYSITPYLTGLPDSPEINPNCSYVLRIGNILEEAEAGKFTISIYDKAAGINPDEDKLSIPSRLIIDSQARFGQSLQKVRVRTPMRPPLSGLYDFVLFSEEEIVK